MYSGSCSDDLFRGDAIYNPECNRRDAELLNMAEMSSIDTKRTCFILPWLEAFPHTLQNYQLIKGKIKMQVYNIFKI